jgi:thiol-disulfide isomerase/thioredoxin
MMLVLSCFLSNVVTGELFGGMKIKDFQVFLNAADDGPSLSNTLVLFTYSWCSISEAFYPEFEYLSHILPHVNKMHVDVTSEHEFTETQKIYGLPHLRFYYDRNSYIDYESEEETNAMAIKIWYMKRMQMLTSIDSIEDAVEMGRRSKFFIVLNGAGADSEQKEDLISLGVKISAMFSKIEVGLVENFQLAEQLKLGNPSDSLVFYFPHNPGYEVYKGPLIVEAVSRFVKSRLLEWPCKLWHDNAKEIVEDGRIVLLLISGSDEKESEIAVKEFMEVTQQYFNRDEILLLTAGQKIPNDMRLIEYLGDNPKREDSRLWIIQDLHQANKMKKFPCQGSTGNITELALDCISKYQRHEIQPNIRFSPVTNKNSGIFTDVDGLEFIEEVKSSDPATNKTSVLVVTHAEWCSNCVKFHKLLEINQQELFKTGIFKIVRIDTSLNDTPEDLYIPYYPAAFIVNQEDLKGAVKFTGNFDDINSFLKWAEESARGRDGGEGEIDEKEE